MDKPIPILFTIPNFITAGSGRAMLNIIERLDREKFAPAVCVMRKGGDLDREVERMGIPFIEAPFTIPAKPYSTLLLRAWKAAQVFRPYRFVLWHSFHYSDDYTEPIIARLAGAKVWIYTKKNMSWGSRAWRLRTLLASGIIAQNTEMIKNFFSNCKNKVKLIHRGVDIHRFAPGSINKALRIKLGFSIDVPVIAHVANLVPVKNHPFLLQAFAKMKTNAYLVLVGDFLDISYTNQIKTIVHELGIQNKVCFLGKINDIPTLLHSVDIFAFCSHYESFPVSVLEAMACGLPCVVTDIPAMREMHEPGKTALIVPQNDIQGFADALDTLVKYPNLRLQIGQAARKRVEKFFTLEQEVKKHEEFYFQLLSKYYSL